MAIATIVTFSDTSLFKNKRKTVSRAYIRGRSTENVCSEDTTWAISCQLLLHKYIVIIYCQ